MKSVVTTVVVVILIVLAGAGGYWYGQRRSEPEAAETTAQTTTTKPAEPPTIAPVTTAPLIEGKISKTLTAYGTVVPSASHQRIVSAEIDIQVVHLLVAAEQHVQTGQPLVNVKPSADASLQWLQAKNTAKAARRELADVKQRYALHLATIGELHAAETGSADAQLKLDDLNRRGAGGPQTIQSPCSGMVANIDVASGQIVPSGGTLLEIDNQSDVHVQLGVDPSAIEQLKVGQSVRLVDESGERAPMEGHILLISHRVDPNTRLVEIFVVPPEGSKLRLHAYMAGQLTLATHAGLMAPRSAVLPTGEGYSLFTVDGGRAVEHRVLVGLENGREVEVIDPRHLLKPGQQVVTEGNYELSNGSSVAVSRSADEGEK